MGEQLSLKKEFMIFGDVAYKSKKPDTLAPREAKTSGKSKVGRCGYTKG
jgi:hypothetical protein